MLDPEDKTTDRDTAADEAAGQETDEQIWNSYAETDGTPPDPDRSDATDDAGDTPDPDDGARDEDDQTPSEDTDDTTDGDGKKGTDGTDPDELAAQVKRLTHQLESEKGRVAASRRELERYRKMVADGQQETARRRGNEDDDTRKTRDEAIAKVREEYGDVVGPLADIVEDLEKRVETLSAEDQARLDDAQERLAELETEQMEILRREHSDGFAAIASNKAEFRDWIEDQPKRVRDIYRDNHDYVVDGTSVALLLSQFKQHLQGSQGETPPADEPQSKPNSRRQRQLDGARSMPSSRRPAAKTDTLPPEDASPEEQWEAFARLEKRADR